MIDRRDVMKLAATGAALLAARPAFAQAPVKPRTRIVFLGTKGGPRVGVGASNPAINPKSVDFPLPEAPVIATNCPLGISKETSSKIVRSSAPERTVFVIFLISIIFLLIRWFI